MTDQTQEACREAFEKWYSAKHGYDPIRSDDGYEPSAGKRSWQCWQAAWHCSSRHSSLDDAGCVEVLEKMESLLAQIRSARNELNAGDLRSAVNVVCDRIDVAISKLYQATSVLAAGNDHD